MTLVAEDRLPIKTAFKSVVRELRLAGMDSEAVNYWLKNGGDAQIGWNEFQSIDPRNDFEAFRIREEENKRKRI
jgi:hypothetical protein